MARGFNRQFVIHVHVWDSLPQFVLVVLIGCAIADRTLMHYNNQTLSEYKICDMTAACQELAILN